MTTSREISATRVFAGICAIPVGNDSIDPYVCEYMAPAPVVFATPVPVVEYIALVPVVSYAAPVPARYAAPAPMVEYIAPLLAVIATPTPLFRYIAPASAVSYVASVPAGSAAPALVVEYIAPALAVIAAPTLLIWYNARCQLCHTWRQLLWVRCDSASSGVTSHLRVP